jgi:hypothetical protein
MVDELLSRRSSFRPGKKIRLANGQGWTLPSPIREWTGKAPSDREAYTGLIRSINEAEDNSERRLAELSFAIFLLDQNYRLSPVDYLQLLNFGSESRESVAWRIAIQQLTEEHVHFFSIAPDFPKQTELVSIRQGPVARLLVWLRTVIPLRWRIFNSRSSQPSG